MTASHRCWAQAKAGARQLCRMMVHFLGLWGKVTAINYTLPNRPSFLDLAFWPGYGRGRSELSNSCLSFSRQSTPLLHLVVWICVYRHAPSDQRRGRGASSEWVVVPTDRRPMGSAGRLFPWSCTRTCIDLRVDQASLPEDWPVTNGWSLGGWRFLDSVSLNPVVSFGPTGFSWLGGLGLQPPQRLAPGLRGVPDRMRPQAC